MTSNLLLLLKGTGGKTERHKGSPCFWGCIPAPPWGHSFSASEAQSWAVAEILSLWLFPSLVSCLFPNFKDHRLGSSSPPLITDSPAGDGFQQAFPWLLLLWKSLGLHTYKLLETQLPACMHTAFVLWGPEALQVRTEP